MAVPTILEVKKILISGGYGRLTLPLIKTALQEGFSVDISEHETLIPTDSLAYLEILDKEKRLPEVVKMSESEIILQILSSIAKRKGFVVRKQDIYLEKQSQHTKANFVFAIPILEQIRADLRLEESQELLLVYIQTPHQQFRTKGTFNSLQEEWENRKIKGVSYANTIIQINQD